MSIVKVAHSSHKILFANELIHSVSPLTWWESQKSHLDNSMLTLCCQVLDTVSSSAGVELIFLFGLVRSKLRNRQSRKTCVNVQTVKPTLLTRLSTFLAYT